MTVVLWYCPPPGSTAYETLNTLIQSIQTLFPNSPVFEPHITLNTHLTVSTKDDVNKVLTYCVAAMNSIKKSIEKENKSLVRMNGFVTGKSYFQKVKLSCELDKYLLSIAQIIRELFVESEQNTELKKLNAQNWVHNDFKPHVSLLYSDIYPISPAFTKIIQQRIEDTLGVKVISNEADEWKFDQIPKNVSWGIPATFKVVNCEGPIEEWEVLGRTDI
ncbi:2',3'-cyclic-nucleotide 3'-phosphodiesterase NDAI_0B00960 [Naumovozyma dairenensis CBS 421]|uniref:2',3'-cyclic-nucleotide 3'-phosphodiesterase n=1 Tax=Naumovozyma dairenensis (strain ATCC 10597 / BCRC 20456 / CBS 421 / NBRC 0211 / NRRL Y-12639) TaxID=1071378 RepID=G0W5R9_NAUDC|nr:hypothetical protein NDAI_0B00960 [Naumovozyma dairenensis CBS 421]CCD23130.1 hypothetical protein NDAI_0B00960 [Naumovozyma dairenensis CBS 421]